VCCAIIGVDPQSVDHIRLASERGFGTTDVSRVRITGDVTLDEAKARGCRQMFLMTYYFQAPWLYERRGFTRVIEIPDWPLGHTHILMRLDLD